MDLEKIAEKIEYYEDIRDSIAKEGWDLSDFPEIPSMEMLQEKTVAEVFIILSELEEAIEIWKSAYRYEPPYEPMDEKERKL